MITLRQVASWARANRKYSVALTVILLVLIALLHPGTQNLRSYSKEVRLQQPIVLLPEPNIPVPNTLKFM